jgi:hypothetical protein
MDVGDDVQLVAELVLAAILVVLIVRAAPVAWREWQDERAVSARRRAGLIARADEHRA